MKKIMMALLAVAFAVNVQAAAITWTISEGTIHGHDSGYADPDGVNLYADWSDLFAVFLILSESLPSFMEAFHNDELSAATPGILGAQMLIPGSAQVETYRTPDIPEIIAGKDYDVYFVMIARSNDEFPYSYLYVYTPFNGKANSENELPLIFHYHYDYELNEHVDGGPFTTPFTVGEVIPEPATGLLALAGVALLFFRRKRK